MVMPIRSAWIPVLVLFWLLEAAAADPATQPGGNEASVAAPVAAAAAPVQAASAPTATSTAGSTQPAAAVTPVAAPTNVPAAPPAAVPQPAPDALQTAVALNYCRASFHRIRRYPTRVVLAEEQEKILNNINLDGIVDREVIQLYTAVLDEINQIGVADYERRLAHQYHGTVMQRKLVWDVLSIGADVATAHYGSAIRTGVNSWWDYRVMDYQRDSDLLRIDKARLGSVVQKSAQFLDTFWQMAQKKKIPDRWLVRGDDLDALEQAMREPDPEVRLRVLKRMEPFMEAYPPYWYYVARNQQELGQLFAAINTYTRVIELGGGHFRKDDMLATALANKAAIQDYLQQPSASESAEKALVYSTDVWEANLICARVLQRSGRYAAAEDAILRNLDVQLETEQSRVFLVALYEMAGERDKLLRQLNEPQVAAAIPAPVLLRCAARLGQESTPPHVLRAVVSSLEGQPRIQFGPDDFVLRAASSWMLNLATLRIWYKGEELTAPDVSAGNGYHQLRYAGRFDWGNPLDPSQKDLEFELHLSYPDRTEVRLVLKPLSDPAGAGTLTAPARAVTSRVAGGPTLRIAQIVVGDDAASPAAPMPGAAASSETGPAPASAVEIPLPPRIDGETR